MCGLEHRRPALARDACLREAPDGAPASAPQGCAGDQGGTTVHLGAKIRHRLPCVLHRPGGSQVLTQAQHPLPARPVCQPLPLVGGAVSVAHPTPAAPLPAAPLALVALPAGVEHRPVALHSSRGVAQEPLYQEVLVFNSGALISWYAAPLLTTVRYSWWQPNSTSVYVLQEMRGDATGFRWPIIKFP